MSKIVLPFNKPSDRIALALDNIPTIEYLKQKAEELAGEVGYFKVGYESLLRFGAKEAIGIGAANGIKVFADAKIKDIPKTMELVSKLLVESGASMFNVHSSNTKAALRAAASVKENAILLGVTILTSYNDEECREVYGEDVKQKSLQFSIRAATHGCDGIVCSSQELVLLNKNIDTKDLIKVVPGIQPTWMGPNDQVRVMTPYEAMQAGADILVIGRAIMEGAKYESAGSPVAAARLIAEEIRLALAA